MGIPPRHGPDWGQQGPSAAEPTGGARQGLGAFFAGLPPEALQFLSHTGEIKITGPSLVAGQRIEISRVQVPENFAFVITDVQYYALVPSKYLGGPLIALQPEQLVGLIRFDLIVQDRQPMRSTGEYINPYMAGPRIRAEGWPFVEISPTSTRDNLFLYAKSKMTVAAKAWIDVVPRFWLSMLGVRITGYTLPELVVVEAIKRANRA
jgi:hypothetical protein